MQIKRRPKLDQFMKQFKQYYSYNCWYMQFTDRCNFEFPLDDTSNPQTGTLPTVNGTAVVGNVLTNGDYITASLAIEVDGLSIIVVAYSNSTRTSHSISFVSYSIIVLISYFSLPLQFQKKNDMMLGVSDSFKVNPMSSAVGTLQWHFDLEYIYATSMTAVSNRQRY